MALDRVRAGKLGDDRRISLLQIPEVVNVAVGQDDEASALRARILAGLLLGRKRVFILRLGLKDDQRLSVGIQKEEVDEAVFGLFEVLAESVDVGRLELDIILGSRTMFAGPAASSKKRQPASSRRRLILIRAVASLLAIPTPFEA